MGKLLVHINDRLVKAHRKEERMRFLHVFGFLLSEMGDDIHKSSSVFRGMIPRPRFLFTFRLHLYNVTYNEV